MGRSYPRERTRNPLRFQIMNIRWITRRDSPPSLDLERSATAHVAQSPDARAETDFRLRRSTAHEGRRADHRCFRHQDLLSRPHGHLRKVSDDCDVGNWDVGAGYDERPLSTTRVNRRASTYCQDLSLDRPADTANFDRNVDHRHWRRGHRLFAELTRASLGLFGGVPLPAPLHWRGPTPPPEGIVECGLVGIGESIGDVTDA